MSFKPQDPELSTEQLIEKLICFSVGGVKSMVSLFKGKPVNS